jgi:hypothetical protein
MKRYVALVALVVVLAGCSVSINEDSPQVVVVATATVPAVATVASYYQEFSGTMKVSGSFLRFADDGTCKLLGLDIAQASTKAFPMITTPGGYMSGYLRFTSATTHDDQCWYAFDTFAGYPLDVNVNLDVPGIDPLFIAYDDFKDGGPVTVNLITP